MLNPRNTFVHLKRDEKSVILDFLAKAWRNRKKIYDGYQVTEFGSLAQSLVNCSGYGIIQREQILSAVPALMTKYLAITNRGYQLRKRVFPI